MLAPWYGFNFRWVFRQDHATPTPSEPDERAPTVIRGFPPDRPIVADGIGGGHTTVPGAAGSRIHIGEIGCCSRVPGEVALPWTSDVPDVFAEPRRGWAPCNFEGPFGLVDSGREGIRRDRRNGSVLDGDLLDLLQSRRVR